MKYSAIFSKFMHLHLIMLFSYYKHIHLQLLRLVLAGAMRFGAVLTGFSVVSMKLTPLLTMCYIFGKSVLNF